MRLVAILLAVSVLAAGCSQPKVSTVTYDNGTSEERHSTQVFLWQLYMAHVFSNPDLWQVMMGGKPSASFGSNLKPPQAFMLDIPMEPSAPRKEVDLTPVMKLRPR